MVLKKSLTPFFLPNSLQRFIVLAFVSSRSVNKYPFTWLYSFLPNSTIAVKVCFALLSKNITDGRDTFKKRKKEDRET